MISSHFGSKCGYGKAFGFAIVFVLVFLGFSRFYFSLLPCTDSCCHLHEIKCALVSYLMLKFTPTFLQQPQPNFKEFLTAEDFF